MDILTGDTSRRQLDGKLRILNEGILNIGDDRSSILYEMRKLYERNGRVGVECSGINREYEKQKYP